MQCLIARTCILLSRLTASSDSNQEVSVRNIQRVLAVASSTCVNVLGSCVMLRDWQSDCVSTLLVREPLNSAEKLEAALENS